MNKIKIISMLVTTMFLGLAVSTIGSAVDIQGGIDVSVTGFIGLVTPKINLTDDQLNQSVTFMVNVSDGNYTVEDTLKMPLNINDQSNRTFILPRSLVYCILLVREPSNVTIRPIFTYLKRLIPFKSLFNRAPVVKSILRGNRSENISVTLKYKITSATYENVTENMTLHIYTMGFLPGDSDGISEKLPIIDHKKINLEVTYEEIKPTQNP